MSRLESMINRAHELLDPEYQGEQWPDPVAWDGRPLAEQARDLCALLDGHGSERADRLSGDIVEELSAAADPYETICITVADNESPEAYARVQALAEEFGRPEMIVRWGDHTCVGGQIDEIAGAQLLAEVGHAIRNDLGERVE